MIAALLAISWGTLVALSVAVYGERFVVSRRARDLGRRRRRHRRRRRSGRGRLLRHPSVALVGRVLATPWRVRRSRRAAEAIVADLPVTVDLIGVAVAAGCTTHRAVEIAARWSPPRIGKVFAAIAQATSLGASLEGTLRDAGAAAPPIRRLTDTLRTNARLGAPAGASLTRLAHEVRSDVRRRAETRARHVPVRLLFPLVFCVLPAFALLTVVPVLLDGLPV